MRREKAFVLLLGVALTFWLWFSFFVAIQPTHATTTRHTILQASPTVLTHIAPTPPVVPPQPINVLSTFFNSPLGIAIITLTVGALLAAYFTYFFNRRTKKKETEEAETKEAQKETQRQQREVADRLAAQQAQEKSIENHVQSYRDALLKDDTVASIKILDMTKPVELVNVYVQLRLHQDPRTNYTTDLIADRGVRQLDPNVLLQVMRKRLEDNYASKAIDPVQAIRDNTQSVLLGDPGAGKTTLLKYLTIQTLKKQLTGLPDLPVYIELSKFSETKYDTLLDFTLDRWERFYGFPQAEARLYLEQQLEAGKVLLLLDALDETALGKTQEERDASYRRVLDAITQVATRYPKAYIVVTARIAGYRQRASLIAFTELEVMPLRREDISTFIEQWFKSSDPQRVQQGTELNGKLNRNIRLQTLAANPLLLSLIVVLREKQLSIPEHRAELYKQCVDMLLYEWDRKRNVQRHSELTVEQQKQLLERVAWHFHLKNVRYLPDDELLDTIAKFLANTGLAIEQKGQVLKEMTADNGLLKEQAEGWYGFLHLTFQEYFAALYAYEQKLLNNLLQHRNDPWWEEVILLYAGSAREIAPLLKKLLGQDSTCPIEDDIFSTNIMLAGSCLAAHPPRIEPEQEALPLEQEVIKHLFDILLNTPYSLTRQQAADTLAEVSRTEAGVTTRLLQLLSNTRTNTDVMRSITTALGEYGEHSLATKMLQILFDPNVDQAVRVNSASALSILSDYSIIPVLQARLRDKSVGGEAISSIVDILSIMNEHSLASELFSLFLDVQEDYAARSNIAAHWATVGDPALTSQLITQLTSAQTDAKSKELFAIALSSVVDRDRSALSVLLTFLADKQADIDWRKTVATGLVVTLHNTSSSSELIQIITDKKIELELRIGLVGDLGTFGYTMIQAELQRLYHDPNLEQELRQQLAITLYMLGDSSIPVDTVKILTESKWFGSLERYIIEHKDMSTQLQMLANSKISSGVREGIAGVLANTGDTSVVPELCRVASNSKTHLDVRLACIKALGTFADDEGTARVLANLVNEQQTSDEAQRALWFVSRRARVRVVEDPMKKRVWIVV